MSLYSSSSSSLPESAVWDPRATLRLDAHGTFTCIGFASSKGRRCRNPIASHNSVEIEKAISRLAICEPRATRMQPELEDLALRALCRRNHQDQAPEVVESWQARMRDLRRTLRTTRTVASPMPPSVTSTRSEARSHTERLTRPEGRLYRNRLPSPPTVVSPSPPTPRARTTIRLSRINTDNISVLDLTPASSTTPPSRQIPTSTTPSSQLLDPPATVPSSRVASPPPIPTPPVVYPPSPTDTTPERPPRPTCSRHLTVHSTRRPIEEHCPICYTAMAELPLEALVWCKASCGQSVHRECFDKWRRSRPHASVPLTCVLCRQPWQGPCAHDNDEPRLGNDKTYRDNAINAKPP
ncbi:hypothetical protein K432DRAFT_321429 [Lepidopterella palustris CBS 459.81]|uniref:RING-type domain-containing protein n=1 Tax=Lepidopterella palustris CBS 459.81 TaxID=1314670 RepID=A0A8E2JJ23_9PEZI|nr:hypothetical protein K432DRAFT_321429 [Lepidopterella palustris CBS 459.81]